MSIFDDDFYSTKVSKRTVRQSRREDTRFIYKSGERKWSNVRIAFISSFTSAVAATLLFGAIFGGFGGDSTASGKGGSTPSGLVTTGDPSERAINAAAKVSPAVVSIINEQLFGLGLGSEPLEGDEAKEGEGVLREAGVGSGVIIKKKDGKAYIVTNYHVVAGAQKVRAVLTNGEVREASVVGMDQITDLAVLAIDDKGIDTVAEIGDSSALRKAEFVMAIGNPLGMGESITMGVVSVIEEVVPVSLNQNGVIDWEQEVIRVDAAINQGNSGGPLIDMNGHVVGINSMKIADFGVESIGYAIPINKAMPVLEELMDQGYVSRPYLGVYTLDLEQYWQQQNMDMDDLGDLFGEDGEGSGSAEVEPGAGGSEEDSSEGSGDGAPTEEDKSDDAAAAAEELNLPDDVLSGVIVLEAVGPALKAGLQFNDVIVELDGHAIGSTMELRKYLYSQKKIGDNIEVSYYRDGELKKAKFKLGENEAEE
ncbi:trypsin-like peptidase domain-containing protein [Paenibacillus sp. LHD-117]|uniref:S1C family serine protease n=1 Tax=Paenibacillus sp. LHD-117 TaxID=3071412 RepID=UPI0027DF8731|nr:trypsin-like peptidase domain-containing protein [Paenibacillus sp. LHD-117]MDQ6421927.1 trypsin-like peptidase domain-containing protein [Paenibacillus sp. LHD-117]